MLLVDLKTAVGNGMTVRPIRAMINHATTEVFFDNLEVPVENRVGEEGKGFRYLLDGLNAERILIAAECVGGRALVRRAGLPLRPRPGGVQPPHRPEPGHTVSPSRAPTSTSRRPI